MVEPTGKLDPGSLVLTTRLAVPELSVAVGSTQLTATSGVPKDTVRSMFEGQFEITGIVSSTKRKDIQAITSFHINKL